MARTSTPTQYALILIDLVESRGFTLSEILAGTTLAETGLSGIGARVDDDDFSGLVKNAFELTRDPALGLKLGLKLNLSAHAVLGQAFLTCQNLREVLDLFLKYYHLVSPNLQLEFELGPKRCVLTTMTNAEELPVQFGYELIYGGILNTLSGLLALPDLQLQIELPYTAPKYAAQYYEVFGPEVYFNCVHGRVSFDSNLLNSPLPSSNPALRKMYEAECERLLADLKLDSIAEQTTQLLRKLEGQYPQMPQIAKILNLSPRTYRRRLDEEQQSYQTLLDQVRAEHATRYLLHSRMQISTIAHTIGYNDISNFRRAYKRWTGVSPGEARKKGSVPF